MIVLWVSIAAGGEIPFGLPTVILIVRAHECSTSSLGRSVVDEMEGWKMVEIGEGGEGV